MRLYLDTEFNGFGGELISMALVTPSGLDWYGVRELPKIINPWVAEHVIPKLNAPEMLGDGAFRKQFHNFLRGFRNPEIICDWPADAVHFCQWMAGDDYGSSLDYAFTLTVLKTPPGFPKQGPMSHNAMYDAIALMEWHQTEVA